MKRRTTYLFAFLLIFIGLGSALFSQSNKTILLLDGVAHLGNGEVIQKSAIGIENGKIKEVYNANVVNASFLKYDTVINISGKHVYPGFIAPNSILGLIEIEAVRASKDHDEVGEINPHIRSLIAYNTESKVTATVRTNGVLMAQITPRGGRISGTSSIVSLDGWNWEDAAYKVDDGNSSQLAKDKNSKK